MICGQIRNDLEVFKLARADDPVKFKRMYAQHMALEKIPAGVTLKKGFSDELQPIGRREPRSCYEGVRIKPTNDTLNAMRGKYR